VSRPAAALGGAESGTPTVWTIGHSTRDADEFVRILQAHRIELVADVRRFPGSRRNPQYSGEAIARTLAASSIEYRWIELLGGRRRPDADSPNLGWRHPAFRAYADYVETEAFAAGLAELLDAAYGLRTAVMCSELLWWRCHRRLVADVLTSLGLPVVHIRDETHAEPHRLGPPARLVAGRLSYRS